MLLDKSLLLQLIDPYDFSTMPFSKERFIDALLAGGRVSNTLSVTNSKLSTCIKKLFPNKKPKQSYIGYLLLTNNIKLCNICSTIKSISDFGCNKTNLDGLASSCIICHNKQQSRYYYNDPDAQVARVRKRDRSLDRALSSSEIITIFTKYDNKCVQCQYTNEDHNIDYGENLHLDHIVPFSKGGLTTVENTQLLCKSCNSKKGNKAGL